MIATGLNRSGWELRRQTTGGLEFIRTGKQRIVIDLEPNGTTATTTDRPRTRAAKRPPALRQARISMTATGSTPGTRRPRRQPVRSALGSATTLRPDPDTLSERTTSDSGLSCATRPEMPAAGRPTVRSAAEVVLAVWPRGGARSLSERSTCAPAVSRSVVSGRESDRLAARKPGRIWPSRCRRCDGRHPADPRARALVSSGQRGATDRRRCPRSHHAPACDVDPHRYAPPILHVHADTSDSSRKDEWIQMARYERLTDRRRCRPFCHLA
jgi:hypothetical protein